MIRTMAVVAMMRTMAVVATATAIAGCAGGPQPVARAQVRFVIVPETARVYTDERFVGSARVLASRASEFRAGPRRFTITAEGYFPHDLEVELAPGATTIEISLRPIPP